jgi:hypothetical protein
MASEEVGSGGSVSIYDMSTNPNSAAFGVVTQALSSAVKLAAFKLRTQRYIQVIFRMFSM